MKFISSLAVLASVQVGLYSRAATAFPATSSADDIYFSHAELLNWLATTDANVTFIGKPIDATGGDRALVDVNVVYCSSRVGSVCGGACTVYNGGATCLNAPDTNCLRASANVGFCDRAGCTHSCNLFNSCGTRLDNNFCFTPGTRSISVPFI